MNDNRDGRILARGFDQIGLDLVQPVEASEAAPELDEMNVVKSEGFAEGEERANAGLDEGQRGRVPPVDLRGDLENVVTVWLGPDGDGAVAKPAGSQIGVVGREAGRVGGGDGLGEAGAHDADEIDGIGEGGREIK